MGMQRALIDVEPDDTGWCIQIAEHAVARNIDKLSAMHRASEIARDCHENTGVPTGVRVRMLCGDEVLIGLCG